MKIASTTVLRGEVSVLPVNVQTTSGADPDTCFYELRVDYGTSPVDFDPPAGTDPLYESKIIELTIDVVS